MAGLPSALRDVRDRASAIQHHYEQEHDRPLGGYVLTAAAYVTAVGGAAGMARRGGKRPPRWVSPWDVTLLALATNKYARLVAKDPVTSPIRAPFTRYEGTEAPAEVSEQVRGGGGARHAVGELISCPFCVGQWIATAMAVGLVFAPRLTRLVAATGAALFGSDVLQYGYAWLQQSVSE